MFSHRMYSVYAQRNARLSAWQSRWIPAFMCTYVCMTYARTHSRREHLLEEHSFYKRTPSGREHILYENTFYTRTHSIREYVCMTYAWRIHRTYCWIPAFMYAYVCITLYVLCIWHTAEYLRSCVHTYASSCMSCAYVQRNTRLRRGRPARHSWPTQNSHVLCIPFEATFWKVCVVVRFLGRTYKGTDFVECVDRLHYDIFGTFYPPAFQNW